MNDAKDNVTEKEPDDKGFYLYVAVLGIGIGFGLWRENLFAGIFAASLAIYAVEFQEYFYYRLHRSLPDKDS